MIICMNETKQFWSMTEIAKDMALSRAQIFIYVSDGRLPSERIGHLIVVRDADYQNWKRRHQSGEFRRWAK
jgi:predicted DNA-binding transcriptional regulator AlpA